jgi:hypothetical protein
MFGVYQFGASYFGQGPGETVVVVISDCGGMWGTATFGSPYFGQHLQCGEIPPVPPVPPVFVGGGRGQQDLPLLRRDRRTILPKEIALRQSDEDFHTIVTVFLSIR